jgi:hypothetical protein
MASIVLGARCQTIWCRPQPRMAAHRHTGPWPQQGFNLIPDLDASLSCTVPSCRCPPNLSAWRPAATFFELEEANSKNVSNAVGTASLRPCVQHECATDGANPCAKTGACFVRSRWGQCAKTLATACRELCEQCGDIRPNKVRTPRLAWLSKHIILRCHHPHPLQWQLGFARRAMPSRSPWACSNWRLVCAS